LATNHSPQDFSDFSYGIGNVAYWSLLEPGFGVICCGIPVFQPVVSKFSSSSLWSKRTPVHSLGHKYGNGKSKDREEGKTFPHIGDALYPLTDTSLDLDSELGVDHTSDAPQTPERAYQPSGPPVVRDLDSR
jgi:hypothetical protein